LKDWDYASPWWYYVTINTKNHEEWFGNIENGDMHISAIGNKVIENWNAITKHFESVELDYFVIMPNHIDGIIIINDSVDNDKRRDGIYPVSKFRKISLSTIVGTFKASITRWCNKNGYLDFAW